MPAENVERFEALKAAGLTLLVKLPFTVRALAPVLNVPAASRKLPVNVGLEAPELGNTPLPRRYKLG